MAHVDVSLYLGWHGWALNPPYREYNQLTHNQASSSTCVLEGDAHGGAESMGAISVSRSFYKLRPFKAA